jgi:biopolymer transport protein ExbB/TolQ
MVVLFWMMIVCITMTSAIISFFSFILLKDSIWSKVKKFRNDLTLNRHFHHLRMMEKYIELGDKEKSELLFKQYIESKYWDQNSASFFDGAIRSKFHSKLNFKITYNGKEL